MTRVGSGPQGIHDWILMAVYKEDQKRHTPVCIPCLSPCVTLCHLGTLPARRPPAVTTLTSRSTDRNNPVLYNTPSMWYCVVSNKKSDLDITGYSHLSCSRRRVGDRSRKAGERIFLNATAPSPADPPSHSRSRDEEPLTLLGPSVASSNTLVSARV